MGQALVLLWYSSNLKLLLLSNQFINLLFNKLLSNSQQSLFSSSQLWLSVADLSFLTKDTLESMYSQLISLITQSLVFSTRWIRL